MPVCFPKLHSNINIIIPMTRNPQAKNPGKRKVGCVGCGGGGGGGVRGGEGAEFGFWLHVPSYIPATTHCTLHTVHPMLHAA